MTASQQFSVGQEVIFKNVSYTIKDIEITEDVYPNIKKNSPHVELHIIVVGKRGALKAGFITTKGNVFLF